MCHAGGLLSALKGVRSLRRNLENLVLGGASRLDRCIAQASNCAPRGCIVENMSQSMTESSMIRLVSNRLALESRSDEILSFRSGFKDGKSL